MSSRSAFRAQRGIMVRSVLLPALPIPPAPDLTRRTPAEADSWRRWLLETWRIPQIAVAVRYASPDLARDLDDLATRPDDTEGLGPLVLTLLSYVLRLSYRVTPFGLFAGVAEGRFGAGADVRWGEDHQSLTRANGEWLAAVVQQLESHPQVRRQLRIAANNALRSRGERLVLPWQQRALDAKGTALHEVAVIRTAAVEAAVRMTATPLPYRDVAGKLAAAHPELGVRGAEELLDLLIARRMLLTSLQPSGTDIDGLGHVVRELARAVVAPSGPAAELVSVLPQIHAQIRALNQRPSSASASQEADRSRGTVTGWMRQVVDQPSPLAVDVRMDADMTLPRTVSWEAEAAASVLARVTPEPHGTQAWIRYRDRFRTRYGDGTLVPLLDLLDPHTGLGLPEDYHGTVRAPQPHTVRRDQLLVALAQRAVAQDEDLVLDEALIKQLAGDREAAAENAPAHVELAGSIHAPSVRALNAGEFCFQVRRVGRGWGHFSGGRLAAALAGQDAPSELLGMLARRPTTVHGALPVQLSFPALLPQAIHITHAPRLVAPLISLSEFREGDPDVIAPDDLAVICDQERLHLVSLSRGKVLEAAIPHPLQLECQTPAVARFLDEMQRGQSRRLIGSIGDLSAWDWGAARHLAVRPRVRTGRTILSPATWRLAHTSLPGPGAPVEEWEKSFAALRAQWRLPRHVYLEHFDTPLRLDLGHPAHRMLLRSHLERPRSVGQLTLIEAEPQDAYDWCGGRPHEIVTYLSSTAPRRPAPAVREAPLTGRAQAHLPGASAYLSARLSCQPQVRHALLVDHLPQLVAELPGSIWWITPRDEDEHPHTELTIRLGDPSKAADAMRTLGVWASHLVDTGVISDIALVPYRPHVGLWGNRQTRRAAEVVWAADSAVLAHQHAHPSTLAPQPVLAAANLVAIVAGLHQDVTDGMRWLAAQPKPRSADGLPRALSQQARELIFPGDWAGLRHAPAGRVLLQQPWAPRHAALDALRTALKGAPHVDMDAVLHALLATHLRLAGETPDGTAWRLARSVALARTRPRRQTT
ncbi:lantibiotic dehydratase [Streptomyces sp. NBC_01433]|uniref:lantibiotic dehydratase n=1 Tax=Streptomyces sp. NBC_01433 TaxID=2903864 RepID=UPI002252820E|nr:lantibiotic dehydratase [Streptomyces sp. NBC_01433]MCX4682204.1 lantibiotic dehydratase [Streptomyces sp. NBC_01433]